ncbi:hypothetical protein CKM354_000640600 [Cercospora kikuchii]|uniref:F-box domain-containing protein n=1 Tax=Cercospora kikuchii TaxID=84275 RepID=A0A9P3CRL8_9PEZI|nr:uncharacterized protein CKM354_000640600 [Cercospora kikuchii]GIZ43168.1 hypothetical protein CKM354_000640600 [Cercospora kikuchii]
MTSHLELVYKQPRVAGQQRLPIYRPTRLAFEDVKHRCDNHNKLEKAVEKLHEELAVLDLSPEVIRLLNQVKTAATATQAYSDELWRLVPALHRPSARSAQIAEKVFGTAELLEEVLTYLPLDQILSAMRVQRSWCNTVIGSIKLQRMLGLAAPSHSFFDSPFSHRPNRQYSYQGEESIIRGLSLPNFMSFEDTDIWSDWNEWTISYTSASEMAELKEKANFIDLQILCRPSLGRAPGARMAAIQLCYPPIDQLSILIDCPCGAKIGNYGIWQPLTPANSSDSMTVGELASCTNEVLRSTGHVKKECLHAEVRFLARVQLSDTDPITLHRREIIEMVDPMNESRDWHDPLYRFATDVSFEYRPGYFGAHPELCNNPCYDLTTYIDEGDVESSTDEDEGADATEEKSSRGIIEEDDDAMSVDEEHDEVSVGEEEDDEFEDEDDRWQREVEMDWLAADDYFRKEDSPYDEPPERWYGDEDD